MGLLHQLYSNIVVMGDLNTRMNLCKEGHNAAGEFLEDALKNSKYFERVVFNEPTFRNKSVLDHAIISKNLSGTARLRSAAGSTLVGSSDHVPIIFHLEMPEAQAFNSSSIVINKEKAARLIEQRIAERFNFQSQDFSESVETFCNCNLEYSSWNEAKISKSFLKPMDTWSI